MTNQEERRFRLNEILKAVPKDISKEKFLAQQMFKWGFARRTILEYVNTLIKAEYIKEVDGRLQKTR